MWVLKRDPGGLMEFMTFHKDYSVGSTYAVFSPDPKVAFGFARKEDVEAFQRQFRHFIAGGPATPWELRG